MKNKLSYIFMSLLMCFTFVGNVYADGITVTTQVDSSNVTKGETKGITIRLTTDKLISSCQFKIESDSNIVFDEVKELDGWKHTGTPTEGITVTKPSASTIVPDNLGISQLNYTVNGDGKVTIKDIKCTIEEDSQEYTADNLEVNFTTIEPADDTTLKSLSVTGGTVISLKPDNFDYATSISSSTFGLVMEASNSDYNDDIVVKDNDGNTITDINNITFNDPTGQGHMVLSIIVNDKTTYKLLVNYVKKELDNSLSSIKINGSDLSLEDGKTDYTIDVDSDVDSVLIEATVKDSENFQIGKDSNILSGEFTIVDVVNAVIVVEPKSAEIGSTSKTYTILIKKKNVTTTPSDTPSNDEPSDDKTPNNGDDVTTNPGTGDISMFVMAFILIASLVGSVILYQKNLESYK